MKDSRPMTSRQPAPDRTSKDPRQQEVTVEFGILSFYGMRGVAEELHRDARAVSARLTRAAKASVRASHGRASGFAGPAPWILFLSVLICGTTIVATNGLAVGADAEHRRFDADAGLLTAIPALLAAAALLAVALIVGRRTVDGTVFAVSMRTGVVYVLGFGAAALAWTNGLIGDLAFFLAAALLVLAAALSAWFWLGRRLRPEQAAAIDGAPGAALRAQVAVMEREREALRARLREAFAARTDTAAIIHDRNTALGRPAEHPDAGALPGESIITQGTSAWVRQGSRWPGSPADQV